MWILEDPCPHPPSIMGSELHPWSGMLKIVVEELYPPSPPHAHVCYEYTALRNDTNIMKKPAGVRHIYLPILILYRFIIRVVLR